MKVVPFDGATFGAAIDLGYPIHQGPGSVDGFEDLDADGALDVVTVSDAFTRGVMTMSYGTTAACPADLNADGVLNFFDLARFVALHQQQDPAADLNGDGLFNFFDFSAYLAAFNAGCP